jgi:hypothetical protein
MSGIQRHIPPETIVEDEYMGVLQNLEFAIVEVYNEHPDLTDFHVDKALESLLRLYQAEKKERAAPVFKFGELDQQVYQTVGEICRIHLGRSEPSREERKILEPIRILSVDEIILCLKRLRSSLSLWTKEFGRRGYLDFISQFFI